MKRFLPLALVLLTGCAGAFRNNYSIGMSEEDFKKNNVGEQLVEMSEAGTIYSIPTASGASQFVYFLNGKLVKVDSGVRRPDILIQTTN